MNDMYTTNQLPKWILSDGTKNRSLDVNEYLYRTKFDQSFDDDNDDDYQESSKIDSKKLKLKQQKL